MTKARAMSTIEPCLRDVDIFSTVAATMCVLYFGMDRVVVRTQAQFDGLANAPGL
jgi:hypothetical protein